MKSKIFKSSFENVFRATKKALNELDMDILKSDINRKTIVASLGTSLFSWGENIQIRFNEVQGGIKVVVESNSKAQLIDWGKNSANEQEIIEEITSILKK